MKGKRAGGRWTGALLVLLGAGSYGFVSPITKLAYGAGWGVDQVSISMMLWGTALTWLLVAVRPKLWRNPFRGPWIRLSLTGILGLTLTTYFMNEALSRLSAALAIVLLFQFTWITMLIEAVLDRRKPKLTELLAAAVILAGTLLAAGLLPYSHPQGTPAGWIFGLLSAITYSMFILFMDRIPNGVDAIQNSAVMLTAGLLAMLLWTPWPQTSAAMHTSLAYWGILLGILGPILPTILYSIGIPRVGGTAAAILGALELPVAVLAAHALVGEPILPWQAAGIGCILLGIVLAQMTDR